MPAVASIEELREVDAALRGFQASFSEAHAAITGLLRKHRKVGYKNIAKLLLGEATPEKLKGEAPA